MLKNSSKKNNQKPVAFLRLNFSHTNWLFSSKPSEESYDACLQSCRDSPELKEGLQDFTDRSPRVEWCMMDDDDVQNYRKHIKQD